MHFEREEMKKRSWKEEKALTELEGITVEEEKLGQRNREQTQKAG